MALTVLEGQFVYDYLIGKICEHFHFQYAEMACYKYKQSLGICLVFFLNYLLFIVSPGRRLSHALINVGRSHAAAS